MQTKAHKGAYMTKKVLKQSWKIGELANDTGLTVRTLHYYDELGLLKPSQETEGGHRVYTKTDLERLQKILTLKQLGFPLDKIKEAISNKKFSLKDATARLKTDIQKRKKELEDIEVRLAKADKLQSGKESSTDSIVQLLSRMNLLDRHLSKEQLEWIKQHDLQFGPEALTELRDEWVMATEDLQSAINQKLSPSDWRTKAICMRWFGLACAMMGGSFDSPYDLKKIAEADPKAALELGIPGADLKKVFEYVELVLAESRNSPIPKALAYAQVGVSDLKKSRKFYDVVLGGIEMKPIFHRPTQVIYGKTNPEFFISTKTSDKKSLSIGNAMTVGFWATSAAEVDKVYALAIEAGGKSVEKPHQASEFLYTCYVQDLDGNNLEIMKWTDNPNKPTG